MMPAARVRRELLRTPQRVEKPLLALAFAPDRLPNTPVLGRFEPDSWSPSAQRRLFGRLTASTQTLCLAYLAVCATTLPAVMWGGFGNKGSRCCPTNSPALQFDSSSPDALSKMLVETITPSPPSTTW